MKIQNRSQNIMAEINITPFTDVVLVLLIIFMVATPIIYQNKIKIQLPQAKTEQNQDKPLKVTVLISETGEIMIENKKFSLDKDVKAIEDLILNKVGTGPESTVIINGDKNCRYEWIVAIIDAAKTVGVKRIMLGTDVKKS